MSGIIRSGSIEDKDTPSGDVLIAPPSQQMDLSRADSIQVSKEEYIPYVFAEGKIRQMANSMSLMKDKYEKHIIVLTDKSTAKIKELKEYYDAYIKDMKKKALHHLNLVQKMNDEKEQLSRLNVKALEDRIDELIDLNSKNRLEFQERLKTIERESERAIEEKMTCDIVLRDMCDELERRDAAGQLEARRRQHDTEVASVRARDEQSAMIRKGVNDSLLAVLHHVEMENMLAQQRENEEKIMATFVQASSREDSIAKEFEEMKEQNAKAQEERDRQRDAALEAKLQDLQQRDELELLAKENVIEELRLEKSALQGIIFDLRAQISRLDVSVCLETMLCRVELKELDDLKVRLKESDEFIAKLMTEQSEEGQKYSALLVQQEKMQKQYADLLVDRDAEKQKAESSAKELEGLRSGGNHPEERRGSIAFELGPRQVGAVPSAADPVPLHLRLKLQALQDRLEEDTKKEIILTDAKHESKHELKTWLTNFEAENGRPASNEDKESIKDRFENQKKLSAELKDLQASMDVTLAETEQLKEKIADLEERRGDPAHKKKKVETSVTVAENDQTPVAVSAVAAGDADGGTSEEELAAIRQDWELEKEQDMQALTVEISNITLQRDQLQILVDTIKNETRTDVLKRMEDELTAKQEQISSMTEASVTAKAEKTKMQSKINELNERAERAEQELVDRDERYLKDLSESEEKRLLAEQVAKQREDIIMKSKAATSGWDAAAHAEEMLDIEVDRAYQNGLKEGRAVVEGDVALLHTSVAEKDKRNIELLEKIGQLESAVKEAELKVEQAEKASSLAVRQARASGGGGGGAPDEETVDELRQVREELDNAQEECIVTSEQLAAAQEEISVCRDQIEVYKTLLAQLSGSVYVAGPSAEEAVEIVLDPADEAAAKQKLLGMEDDIRNAIVEGSKLWKAAKRDNCFALYSSLNDRLRDELKTSRITEPLATAKAASEEVPKSKGAVVLRKALDKLLEDISDDSDSYTAEVAAQAGGSPQPVKSVVASSAAAPAAGGAAVQALHVKLASLEKKRCKLESMAGSDTQVESGVSASLLKRAKEAEEKVIDLRNQLADAKSRPGAGAKRGGGGGGGADSAEVKRLQRRIKDLEASGGGGGGGGDKKALATAEKGFQKKMKDQDTANRKEKTAIEARAKTAEKELADTTEKLAAATQERDQLRIKVKELGNMSSEMEALRSRAAQADEFATIISENKAEIARLTEQYKKEGVLRKKYKNELEDLKGAVRVYARMRPMAQYERDRNCQQIVKFVDETALKVQTSRGEKEFEFDAAFTHTSTQDEVFEDTKRLVESFLDGYNVCLFAYGQTGSGKTFTMTGSQSMPGLTPKAIDELFRLIGERKHCNCRVTTYFVELYNDNLVDLYWVLDNKKNRSGDPPKLDIKVDSKKMVYIKNCVVKEAGSPDELMDLFHKGNKERHTGSTNMNAESSRSHSIFAIMAECYDTTTKKTTMGKLSLVDLAGSERADKTGASAERLKEAQNINKSLSALGDVISALSEGEKFIPYRNNKLTQVMQDSLGGNAKTLMFVNFSPADYNADETVTSLNYAARVKKIVNNASKQAESEEVARLKGIIKKLQAGQQVESVDGLAAAESEPDAAALEALEANRRRREEEDNVAFGADGSEQKS